MLLPDRVKDIVRTLYYRHPAPRNDDDKRRALPLMIAQQVRFELGPTWGTKRADPGRPLAKDSIAQHQPDGKLVGWDLFNGSTGLPHPNPGSIDISDQVFVDVSPGLDHLGGASPPDVTRPPSTGGSMKPYDERLAVEFGTAVNQIYAEAKRAADPGMIAVQAMRTWHDFQFSGLSWAEARDKHLAELRAVYGR